MERDEAVMNPLIEHVNKKLNKSVTLGLVVK